jgi:hypothetical protein
MSKTAAKLRPSDLRHLAARTEEPERARKMLVLAEQLEEKFSDPAQREKLGRRDSVHDQQQLAQA